MRRCLLLTTIALLATSIIADRAEAQFFKHVKERVKQKVAERKMQTEENALARATEPADSALVKVTSPVDSLAARVGGGAGAAVARIGRGKSQSVEEDRLRQELAVGRAELPAVQFQAGADAIDPGSEPSLKALAVVISGSPSVFLVQGRADPESQPQDAALVAGARAAAIKTWLVSNGVPPDRIFAAGDGAAVPNASLVSVTPMQ
jgi:outer membrane protein OmpA-like peptidoglycan-associated protein